MQNKKIGLSTKKNYKIYLIINIIFLTLIESTKFTFICWDRQDMAAFGPPWRRVSVILLSIELALKMILSRNQRWRGEKQITSYFRPSTTRLGQLKTHSGTIKKKFNRQCWRRIL